MHAASQFAIEPGAGDADFDALNGLIIRHLSARHPDLYAFWTQGTAKPEASLENHCDMVYSLGLLGRISAIHPDSVDTFLNSLVDYRFPGFLGGGEAAVSVHNLAYVLGTLNLLPVENETLYSRALNGRTYQLDELVDPQDYTPIFPAKWAYHSWRVSHWLGGIPSILLSLSRSGLPDADRYAEVFRRMEITRGRYVDPETGLIKAYRSKVLHALFQRLYALRHDPALGDLGGIVHLLWIDHAVDRSYIGENQLYQAASMGFLRHAPFMETVPYCLDFDIVQLVRTCRDRGVGNNPDDLTRARTMLADTMAFFERGAPDGYTLHKLPGALATWHECRMIVAPPDQRTPNFPIDIIKKCHWL